LLLDFAFKLKDLHTREFEARLDSHLVDLITGGDPLRQVGFQMLEVGVSQGAIREERYMVILGKLAEWLVQQPTNAPLQAPLPQILDKAVNLKDKVLAEPSRREAIIKWLAARQQPSLPPAERQQTLKHLISFGELSQEVLHDLIPRLVYQAQNEGDEPTRDAIVDGLLALYRHKSPLDRELWNDLHQYRLGLLNGDDNQKKLGRMLDREMRKIRREAGQAEEGNSEQDEAEAGDGGR
jgi:hypothetical protein